MSRLKAADLCLSQNVTGQLTGPRCLVVALETLLFTSVICFMCCVDHAPFAWVWLGVWEVVQAAEKSVCRVRGVCSVGGATAMFQFLQSPPSYLKARFGISYGFVASERTLSYVTHSASYLRLQCAGYSVRAVNWNGSIATYPDRSLSTCNRCGGLSDVLVGQSQVRSACVCLGRRARRSRLLQSRSAPRARAEPLLSLWCPFGSSPAPSTRPGAESGRWCAPCLARCVLRA